MRHRPTPLPIIAVQLDKAVHPRQLHRRPLDWLNRDLSDRPARFEVSLRRRRGEDS